MQLEKQVTSLEISKRLKELGVKQESLFYWVPGKMEYGYEGEWKIQEENPEKYFIFTENLNNPPTWTDFDKTIDGCYDEENDPTWFDREQKIKELEVEKVASAFTVAELGEILPAVLEKVDRHSSPSRKVNLTLHTFPDVQFFKQGEEWKSKGYWCAYMDSESLEAVEKYGDTEADARGKMLVYLLENKLIELK